MPPPFAALASWRAACSWIGPQILPMVWLVVGTPSAVLGVVAQAGFLAKSNPLTPPSTFQDSHLVCSWLDMPSVVYPTIKMASVADSLHSLLLVGEWRSPMAFF